MRLLALMFFAGAAIANPLGYVPNEKSGTLSVIDTALVSVIDTGTDKRISDIAVGDLPWGVAIAK